MEDIDNTLDDFDNIALQLCGGQLSKDEALAKLEKRYRYESINIKETYITAFPNGALKNYLDELIQDFRHPFGSIEDNAAVDKWRKQQNEIEENQRENIVPQIRFIKNLIKQQQNKSTLYKKWKTFIESYDQKSSSDLSSLFNEKVPQEYLNLFKLFSWRISNNYMDKMNQLFSFYPQFENEISWLDSIGYIVISNSGLVWRKTKLALTEYFADLAPGNYRWTLIQDIFKETDLTNTYKQHDKKQRSKDFDDLLTLREKKDSKKL